MNWNPKERVKEPTTWAGIGLVASGLGMIFDSDKITQVGEAVSEAGGEAVASGEPVWQAIMLAIVGGILAFGKERGAKDTK